MITSTDLLNITAIIGIIVFTFFSAIMFHQLTQTLKSIQRLTNEVTNTAYDISLIRNKIKFGAVSIIRSLLGRR